MAYISLEVDLKEINTSDLVEELEERYLDDYDVARVLKMVTTQDAKKFEFFNRVKDRFSMLELEELFKEHLPACKASEEQIIINFITNEP